MADVKINQLPEQTVISDTDVVIVETATSTNKMTVGKLKELLGIDYGGITATFSDSNGSYTKYSNGLMVFQSKISVDTTSTGSKVFYSSQNFLANTPKSVLYSPSSLAALATRNNYKRILGAFMADSSESSYNIYVDSVGDGLVALNVTIIGRWK